jgi:hypothetical protein
LITAWSAATLGCGPSQQLKQDRDSDEKEKKNFIDLNR